MCACLGAGTDFACVWEGAQGRAPGRVGVDGCKMMEGRGGGLGCLPSRMAVLIYWGISVYCVIHGIN
jgi:hypothetical protein